MFKEDFKYYKSRNPPPDLSNVLDFSAATTLQGRVRRLTCTQCQSLDEKALGLKPATEWEVYELTATPGLIFIRNPFTRAGQQYWSVRCLRDYSSRPSKLNLDAHRVVSQDENWWDVCQVSGDKSILKALRWATLGYHHNWDTKVYSEDSKCKFPRDLAALSQCVAQVLGYGDFQAEAAIINYYHMDSTLSGHTDHSEQFLEAPLFSFSFGQSAIFLLGGKTLDVKPTAMFLHSGDVIVMSQQSRLCFHGVPRITQAPEESWEESDEGGGNEHLRELNSMFDMKSQEVWSWKPFDEYLRNSRINMNIRQVLRSQCCIDTK